MAEEKQTSGLKKVVTIAGIVGATAAPAFLSTSCKDKDKDPVPQDTTSTGTGNPVDSTAIKDSIAKAEEAKLIAAARERVTFGGKWAEFYAGPTATGHNDAGQLMETEDDRQRFRNDMAAVSKKFPADADIAVEPFFVSRDVMPQAVARVNLTGVDQRNRSIQSLLDKLNQIGDDAYLRDGSGKRVVYQGLDMLNFGNSKVGDAVKEYVHGLAQDYKGVFIVGPGDFERYCYANDRKSDIDGMRNALQAVCKDVQALNKKAIVGDIASIASGKGVAGFAPESSLGYFVAKNCTKDIQYYVDYHANKANFNTYYGDPNINFFVNHPDANVRFSVLNEKDMSDDELKQMRTDLGKTTGFYVGGKRNPNQFYAGLYTGADPKVKSVNVYVASDGAMMARGDLDKNVELKGKNLRVDESVGLAPIPNIDAATLEKYSLVVPVPQHAKQ